MSGSKRDKLKSGFSLSLPPKEEPKSKSRAKPKNKERPDPRLKAAPEPAPEQPQTDVEPQSKRYPKMSLYLDEHDLKRLKVAAALSGRKQNDIVAELVRAWLDEQDLPRGM